MRLRVLITGGTGFLGRRIADQLLEVGHEVTVLARSKPEGALRRAAFAAADVCDINSLRPAFEDIDVVCHAAGIPRCVQANPGREAAMHEVNGQGTRNVCRAAALAGARRVVVVSSIAVYGSGRNKLLTEADDCLPDDGYAASKLRAEAFAAAVSSEFGIAVTALRLGPLYGVGHAGNVRRLLEAIGRRRFYPVGPGVNRKSLLHVDDAARACRLAIESEPRHAEPFSVYNVAGDPVGVAEIAARACEVLGRRPYRAYLPAFPFRLLSRIQACPRAIGRWLADEAIDSSRFAQTFGWRPEIDLAEGFRLEADALRSGQMGMAWSEGPAR